MRPPKSKNPIVSRAMRSNVAKNTKPEMLTRKVVYAAGYRGYRVAWAKAPGRPDVAFVSRKVALVIHGCFWHGCKKCIKGTPRTNRRYWTWKIDSNRRRDRRDLLRLKRAGWRVFVIWEHDIKKGNFGQMLSWLRAQRLTRLQSLQ